MILGCFQTTSGFTCGVCFPLKRQRSTGSCVNSVEVYSTEVLATERAPLSAFCSPARSLNKVSQKVENDRLLRTSFIFKKNRHEGALTVKWLWVISSKLWWISILLPQKFISFTRVSLEKKPTWELPLPTFLLIHMKLMLFTDFLQTHQSNLHPSDRFPLLNFTQIFGGDANPSNNHRVKTGLWDLRET